MKQCEACGGAGWLWGRELMNPSEDTVNDSQTHYTCDRCGGRKTIYIIGRFRGVERYNYEAFLHAAHMLRCAGWNVINPHDEDLVAGFDVRNYRPEENGLTWDDYPPLFDVAACLARNLANVERADAVFVLSGGIGSNGVRELIHAMVKNKEVYQEEDGYPNEKV